MLAITIEICSGCTAGGVDLSGQLRDNLVRSGLLASCGIYLG